MANLTDVDEFTDPVQVPDDGQAGDEAAFALAPQDLANRTRNLKNRLDALPIAARYSVSGSAQYSVQEATLAEDFDTLGNFSLSSNLITVPAVGAYWCSLFVIASSDLTGSPEDVEAALLSNSSVSWSGDVVELRAYTQRFSSSAGDSISLTSTGLVNITDTAAQKLFVSALAGDTLTISASSKLSISKVPS